MLAGISRLGSALFAGGRDFVKIFVAGLNPQQDYKVIPHAAEFGIGPGGGGGGLRSAGQSEGAPQSVMNAMASASSAPRQAPPRA